MEGEITETLELDGVKWIRVWRRERPGLLHLVWEIVK